MIIDSKLYIKFLDTTGTKVVTYPDDLVVQSYGKFLDAVSDVLCNTLKVLSTWVNKSGLNVNSAKIALVYFTHTKIIQNFRLPKLNIIDLSLFKS